MRTTLDLPDDLFRRLKATAALKGMPVKRLLREAVEQLLTGDAPSSKQRRAKFPVLDSEQPGSLRITNREIDDLLA